MAHFHLIGSDFDFIVKFQQFFFDILNSLKHDQLALRFLKIKKEKNIFDKLQQFSSLDMLWNSRSAHPTLIVLCVRIT